MNIILTTPNNNTNIYKMFNNIVVSNVFVKKSIINNIHVSMF